MKNITLLSMFLMLGIFLSLNSCSDTDKKEAPKTVYASEVIPFFNHWNLILADGSNAGQANDFEHQDFFYTANDGKRDWVVYKAPNSGDTHGTSNNTRTELAQTQKWSPITDAKLTASLKVMNVSSTGDARVAASYSVVI
ncbi:MAG: polysaccharide lyase family 7 protein, partial [Bacteroidia bacterium]